MTAPRILWTPTPEIKNNSNLQRFMAWLQAHHGLVFSNYNELWQWSVDHVTDFWAYLTDYFDIRFHHAYSVVRTETPMIETEWFPHGTLNYAEHLFRHKNPDRPAILFQSERHELQAISWAELEARVAAFAQWLQNQGVETGDRVVAYLPNIPEATIAFMATCSIGAVWSSCSPDFGISSVIDRFRQIEPRVLVAVDGYQYNGKAYDKMETLQEICAGLPSLEKVVMVPYLNAAANAGQLPHGLPWSDALETPHQGLSFVPVPFDHPIWVLYSSGTTGAPKAITHGHGGVLLEHYKYLAFHNDVHPGEVFFWFSTTGWMMWNFLQGALLLGATIALYDGGPGYPSLQVLWRFAEQAGVHHFGTSAPFIVACMKRKLKVAQQFDLSKLRSIGSTGAPLPPEGFTYVYEYIKPDVWLTSMSGGTDVCTAFVGGCPLEPVFEGEIQVRALGCDLKAYDEAGHILFDEVGEMVITQPMPSMPIYFWNDAGKERYRESYFDTYPNTWRHGDWVRITPRNTLVILGRSDATLNRQGIRIGTAEIYRSLHAIGEIEDSLIVNLERPDGSHFMPLFVVLKESVPLDGALVQRIKTQLRTDYSPRHVPDAIVATPAIPYTISGKKMEKPVKKILMGHPVEQAANKDSMRNPEAMEWYVAFRLEMES